MRKDDDFMMEEIDNFTFSHPGNNLISGPSGVVLFTPFLLIYPFEGSGKTEILGQILSNADYLFDPPPAKKILFFREDQPIYGKWIERGILDQKSKGMPDRESLLSQLSENKDKTGTCIIFDDFASLVEEHEEDFVYLFTIASHHFKTSIFLVLHSLFSPALRKLSLNTHRFFLTKSPRDTSQVRTLGIQSHPGRSDYIVAAYNDATDEKFGHLVLDFSPNCDSRLRVIGNMFGKEPVAVYEYKELGRGRKVKMENKFRKQALIPWTEFLRLRSEAKKGNAAPPIPATCNHIPTSCQNPHSHHQADHSHNQAVAADYNRANVVHPPISEKRDEDGGMGLRDAPPADPPPTASSDRAGEPFPASSTTTSTTSQVTSPPPLTYTDQIPPHPAATRALPAATSIAPIPLTAPSPHQSAPAPSPLPLADPSPPPPTLHSISSSPQLETTNISRMPWSSLKIMPVSKRPRIKRKKDVNLVSPYMVVDEVVPEEAPQASVASAPAITTEAARPALEYVLETPQPVALPPPSTAVPQASVAAAPAIRAEAGRPALEYVLETPQPAAPQASVTSTPAITAEASLPALEYVPTKARNKKQSQKEKKESPAPARAVENIGQKASDSIYPKSLIRDQDIEPNPASFPNKIKEKKVRSKLFSPSPPYESAKSKNIKRKIVLTKARPTLPPKQFKHDRGEKRKFSSDHKAPIKQLKVGQAPVKKTKALTDTDFDIW